LVAGMCGALPAPWTFPHGNLKVIDELAGDYLMSDYSEDYEDLTPYSHDDTLTIPVEPYLHPYPLHSSSVYSSPDPSYSFQYSNDDGQRKEEADETGTVRGSYSYITDEGQNIKVEYTAGPQTGFFIKNWQELQASILGAVSKYSVKYKPNEKKPPTINKTKYRQRVNGNSKAKQKTTLQKKELSKPNQYQSEDGINAGYGNRGAKGRKHKQRHHLTGFLSQKKKLTPEHPVFNPMATQTIISNQNMEKSQSYGNNSVKYNVHKNSQKERSTHIGTGMHYFDPITGQSVLLRHEPGKDAYMIYSG